MLGVVPAPGADFVPARRGTILSRSGQSFVISCHAGRTATLGRRRAQAQGQVNRDRAPPPVTAHAIVFAPRCAASTARPAPTTSREFPEPRQNRRYGKSESP